MVVGVGSRKRKEKGWKQKGQRCPSERHFTFKEGSLSERGDNVRMTKRYKGGRKKKLRPTKVRDVDTEAELNTNRSLFLWSQGCGPNSNFSLILYLLTCLCGQTTNLYRTLNSVCIKIRWKSRLSSKKTQRPNLKVRFFQCYIYVRVVYILVMWWTGVDKYENPPCLAGQCSSVRSSIIWTISDDVTALPDLLQGHYVRGER